MKTVLLFFAVLISSLLFAQPCLKRVADTSIHWVDPTDHSKGVWKGIFTKLVNDCGEWVQNPDIFSEWKTVDTLLKTKVNTLDRNWLYDEETMVQNSCGCNPEKIYQQYRVCEITGIRQIRYRTISFYRKDKTK